MMVGSGRKEGGAHTFSLPICFVDLWEAKCRTALTVPCVDRLHESVARLNVNFDPAADQKGPPRGWRWG